MGFDMTEKVGKLLAQAEATTNTEERDAFIAAAQRIASDRSIDLALARQKAQQLNRTETLTVRTITIGHHGQHSKAEFVRLFSRIASANDVRINIAHDSGYVIAFGFDADIDVSEMLYNSLVMQMVEAANAAVDNGEHKLEENQYFSPTTGLPRSDARVFKRSFYQGFYSAVGNRLSVAKAEAQARAERNERETRIAEMLADDSLEFYHTVEDFADVEDLSGLEDDELNDLYESIVAATETEAPTESNVSLVLREKTDEVNNFYKKKSTARGSWRGGSGRSSSSRGAMKSGREAGSRANLSNSPRIGSRVA